MSVKIKYYFKNIENNQPYQIYFEGKIKRIEKFLPKDKEVLLEVEFSLPNKKRKIFYTEFNLTIEGKVIKRAHQDYDPFKSFDKAIDKLISALKKR